MISGNNKMEKVNRTKFRKKEEPVPNWKESKTKHHDKSFYRLDKEENEFILTTRSETNRRY